MLINLQEALDYAATVQTAIGSFNVYNVESLQAVLRGSADFNHPVIIAFGASYDKHMPLEGMAALVKSYCSKTPHPYVLHLDHCRSKETIERAINAGFTSVMYDGSSQTLSENSVCSYEMATLAHDHQVSIEGELGYLNEEDGTGPLTPQDNYTQVADAVRYVQESHVDALAIAIGNAHGIYKGTPHLDFTRLNEIAQKVDVPLVLHGSSGIPETMLQQAIRLGIRKININTELSTTGIRTARSFLKAHTDPNTRFETMTKAAETAMATIVTHYIHCFDLHGLTGEDEHEK